MRRIISQVLIVVLVAVSLASGANCATTPAERMTASGAHAEYSGAIPHDHSHGADPAARNLAATDAGHSAADHEPDQGCSQVHVHCCAFIGILAADAGVANGEEPSLRFERKAAVPYGQLSHPPLRPPRIAD